MAKRYTFMRIDEDAMRALKDRVNKINNVDLRKLGVKNKIKQIDLTRFLFKNRIYISDNELLNMAKQRRKGRLC